MNERRPATKAELAAIRERESKATPGPWTNIDPKRGASKAVYLAETTREEEDIYGGPSRYGPHRDYIANALARWRGNKEHDKQAVANATFMAHARTDIPTLLSHIDHCHALLRRARQELQHDAPRECWAKGQPDDASMAALIEATVVCPGCQITNAIAALLAEHGREEENQHA